MADKPRVLVADNRKVWCNAMVSLLEDNYYVVQSTDLAKAELIVQNSDSPFHVVVVDIQLTNDSKHDLTSGQHTLLEQVKDRAKYTKSILLLSYGPDDKQIRNVARRYKIPVRYCIDKFPSEGFDYKRFERIVAEAANEALREEREYEVEQYTDFELHVGPNGHAIANSSQGQATVNIPIDIPNKIQLSLKLIEKRETNQQFLQNFGQELYDLLFPGPIHAHLQQTESEARSENTKMRIRLRIEADSVASLPLEFMYRNIGGYFLAQNPNTVLSRYLDLPMPPNYVRRREGPLCLLTIIANPSDQTPLNPEDWENIILQALDVPIKAGRVVPYTVKRATLNGIRDALLQQKPDIVQFVGHGVYQGGKGYLALVEDKTDKTWKVDQEQFANIFLGFDDHLGLISLITCESAKSDSPQGFLGIAPKIVQRGTPAVVAMHYKVFIKTAKIFLENFYTSVAARKPVDWAVQWARNTISIEMGLDNREFATPVLYMRAKNGKIF